MLAAVAAACMAVSVIVPAEGAAYHNPLIDPQPMASYISLEKNIKNFLLLGIDKSDAATEKGNDYHTDAVLVIAIDFDANKIDLVSLPRDTLTYVPGIKGIYKLNAAINCGGGKTEEGYLKACEAASWVLGGTRIDSYFAVDMNAMAAIGDAIGGVDFELEMSYTGTFGKYKKGMQHLDGHGIVDYLRARKNASVNSNDLGRTSRQRELIAALIEKVMTNKRSINSALDAILDIEDGFFTNASMADMLAIAQTAIKTDLSAVGSHVITGRYLTALAEWNFTFTDQDNRRAVIKDVYGVEVPELKYVSYAYTKWLMEDGFKIVRYLAVAKRMREEIGAAYAAAMSTGQKEALDAFDAAYERTADAFDAAAETMSQQDTSAMASAGRELVREGNALYGQFENIEKPVWASGQYWYADRLINEVDVNFR